MINDLLKVKSFVEANSEASPELFWSQMYPLLKDNMFALCALDIAFNDLYARKKGKKLYELWGMKQNNKILSNFTIGIDSIDKMLSKMKETPWPVYKIKLGTKEDLGIVRALRQHSNAVFRIDAVQLVGPNHIAGYFHFILFITHLSRFIYPQAVPRIAGHHIFYKNIAPRRSQAISIEIDAIAIIIIDTIVLDGISSGCPDHDAVLISVDPVIENSIQAP